MRGAEEREVVEKTDIAEEREGDKDKAGRGSRSWPEEASISEGSVKGKWSVKLFVRGAEGGRCVEGRWLEKRGWCRRGGTGWLTQKRMYGIVDAAEKRGGDGKERAGVDGEEEKGSEGGRVGGERL